MPVLQPLHVADDVAHEKDAELVFGILREVVAEEQTAARAERKSFDVIFLRVVWRNSIGEPHDIVIRSNSQAADAARGREVLLEQRWRYAQHAGDVVEPVALVVGRQQIGDVDVKVEQIANRVAVLRAIQAVHRLVARNRFAKRPTVERLFQRDGEGLERRLIRTRHALRRHHPAPQLHDHFFPDVGVRSSVGGVHALERKASGLHARGVTGQTVFLDERRIRQGGL